MAKVITGLVAHRSEAGAFLPAEPLLREIPDSELTREGITAQEDHALTALAKIFAEAFHEYREKGLWPESDTE